MTTLTLIPDTTRFLSLVLPLYPRIHKYYTFSISPLSFKHTHYHSNRHYLDFGTQKTIHPLFAKLEIVLFLQSVSIFHLRFIYVTGLLNYLKILFLPLYFCFFFF